MEILGTKINRYAFGDIDKLVKIYDEVIAYEDKKPFKPEKLVNKDFLIGESEWAGKKEEVRNGFINLKDTVIKEKEEIKAKRAENGLENR